MTPRLPWMPLVVDDWLTSPTRLSMTLTERAAYLELLTYQWKEGSLPNDPAALARMIGIGPEEFDSLAPKVLAQFSLRKGRYQNSKLATMRLVALSQSTVRSEKGQKGGLAKARKYKQMHASSMKQDVPKGDLGLARASVSVSSEERSKEEESGEEQTKTSRRAREEKKPRAVNLPAPGKLQAGLGFDTLDGPPPAESSPQADFLAWWVAYPRKVAKKPAERAFGACRSKHGPTVLADGTAAWAHHWQESATALAYIPYPATFLNREQYLDAPPPLAVPASPEDRLWEQATAAAGDNLR